MSKHSPTGRPWQIEERFHADDELEIIGGIDSVDGSYGVPRIVCTHIARLYDNADQEANAAYIVQACNAFPDLVKALEAALDLISEAKGWGTYNRMDSPEMYGEASVLETLGRAALAKAKAGAA